jgi:hypothetical protein
MAQLRIAGKLFLWDARVESHHSGWRLCYKIHPAIGMDNYTA